MRLLLLGGPRFLGRGIADAALAGGHDVTFFNRGKTNPELYPEVERIVGERGGDLAGLRGRTWDAVIDTSGYLPGAVRAAAEALADSGLYCFVSSISVYADFSGTKDEDSTLSELGDLPDDEVTDESYGPLKALCEDAVRQVFETRSLVVRPGLIAGPYDPTGRFTYWPHRIARGGEVLAPAPPERRTQAIDVRDLGTWIVVLCEQGAAAGSMRRTRASPGRSSWRRARPSPEATPSSPGFPTPFFSSTTSGEWMELPLWLAVTGGGMEANVQRALAAGSTFRPLEETVRGALEDAETDRCRRSHTEREAELLAAWHGRG